MQYCRIDRRDRLTADLAGPMRACIHGSREPSHACMHRICHAAHAPSHHALHPCIYQLLPPLIALVALLPPIPIHAPVMHSPPINPPLLRSTLARSTPSKKSPRLSCTPLAAAVGASWMHCQPSMLQHALMRRGLLMPFRFNKEPRCGGS